MLKTPFLLLFLVLSLSNQVIAQPVDVKNYELNAGFYVGRPTYWGDYNGGLLGSNYNYRNGATPGSNFSGDVSYGMSIWLPIKWGISYRQNIEMGTLSYSIPDVEYYMNTPYQIYSFNLQYDLDLESTFNPYFTIGYDYLAFKTPIPNPDPEFISTSNKVGYQDGTSSTIPLTLGLNIKLGRLSTLFIESSLRLSTTDVLDNFRPDDSNFAFENDVIFSYQVGLRVKVIDVVKLLFKPSKAKPFNVLPPSKPYISSRFDAPELRPIPSKIDATIIQTEEPVTEAEPTPEIAELLPEVSPPPVPVPIPVVDLTNRTFNKEDELKKLEEIKKEREEAKKSKPEDEPVPNEKSSLSWDPTIPILQENVSQIPDEIVDNGLVLDTPPPGYYVQVYATVGPITSSRVRQITIDVLKESGILENPDKQVFVMKRKQFYEIRIGVFDTYQNTLDVLRVMQGTYFDSYTLIYLPDNQ